MERISHDEQMLLHAHVAALRSTCGRLQVGAALVLGDNILSTGRNGAPRGLPHCVCGPDSPCTASVHAEANAVAYAARRGGAAEGATLYATHAPCVACAGLLINVGVVRVVYGEAYRLEDGLELLRAARVEVEELCREGTRKGGGAGHAFTVMTWTTTETPGSSSWQTGETRRPKP